MDKSPHAIQEDWKIAFKLPKGGPLPSNYKTVYGLYSSTAAVNEDKLNIACDFTAGSRIYKSSLINEMENRNINKVKLVIYAGGKERVVLSFNSTGKDRMQWLDCNNILSSTYSDINDHNKNSCSVRRLNGKDKSISSRISVKCNSSITLSMNEYHAYINSLARSLLTSKASFRRGSGDLSTRIFYINKNYGGCPVDEGWIMVKDVCEGDSCSYEPCVNTPSILYSGKETVGNWKIDGLVADALVLYLLDHKTNLGSNVRNDIEFNGSFSLPYIYKVNSSNFGSDIEIPLFIEGLSVMIEDSSINVVFELFYAPETCPIKFDQSKARQMLNENKISKFPADGSRLTFHTIPFKCIWLNFTSEMIKDSTRIYDAKFKLFYPGGRWTNENCKELSFKPKDKKRCIHSRNVFVLSNENAADQLMKVPYFVIEGVYATVTLTNLHNTYSTDNTINEVTPPVSSHSPTSSEQKTCPCNCYPKEIISIGKT
ncbi:hypothetical protein KUTeg_017329 [Tegillarca granosa]|uniref:Uncharacterized protein n=1 Tax=Tegillarca granosa TaxID=220873 RepID=A0ABQ9EII2_TEGGR|nr:hypothetical protein KUTeg_017329 [Tegillarca granosa]